MKTTAIAQSSTLVTVKAKNTSPTLPSRSLKIVAVLQSSLFSAFYLAAH